MILMTANAFDFGYPWWLSYGHLTVLLPALAGLLAGWSRKWPTWLMMAMGVVALWAGGALLVMRTVQLDGRPALPTENFLRTGDGRVLDLGAGTGRSALMVLSARPKATLVALDLFAKSFEQHFGADGSPQERLRKNLRAAGVDQRVSIETADMRKLPFEAASFDAIVSSYAVDHVGKSGARQTLAEANRVLKPGGDFLLMLLANDRWLKFAFGPLLSHGVIHDANWWKRYATEAGFQVHEEGTTPGTLYFLLKR
jgi:ubiquinone/menaquinone biosynthesis C-methylase UbiE